jgi:Glycosyltransferase family 92
VTRDLSWGHVRSRLPALRRPRFELAVCAIFRNEAAYLAEWVEFHRRRGVERFWLYDNRSEDGWRDELEPFGELVEVTEWPQVPGQFRAYADCLKRHRTHARWIAFIDLDEFLFSPTGRTIPDVLRAFEGATGVAVNWRVYGANGHETRPPGRVLENYQWRAADSHPANLHVKTIVNPRRTSTLVQNPHFFRHYGAPVGENRDPIVSPFRDPPTADLLRINHYCLRSIADIEHRLRRLDPGRAQRRSRSEIIVPDDEVHDPIRM